MNDDQRKPQEGLTRDLLVTSDARQWADRFIQCFDGRLVNSEHLDRDTIAGWFANAIQTGRDAESWDRDGD